MKLFFKKEILFEKEIAVFLIPVIDELTINDNYSFKNIFREKRSQIKGV